MDSYRVEESYDRLVFPVPLDAYHLDVSHKYAAPDKTWVGIDWVNGQITLHLLTYEESKRWLEGKDIERDDA